MMGTCRTRGELGRLRFSPVRLSEKSLSATTALNRATSSPSSATGPSGRRRCGPGARCPTERRGGLQGGNDIDDAGIVERAVVFKHSKGSAL
jgi:hypothetical protein